MSSSVLMDAGGGVWCAEAVDYRSVDPHAVLKLGISKNAILNRARRGQTWALGQLYGVVAPGLIMTDHIFQGLRRPMSVNGDSQADEAKLVFTWAARQDAQMTREGELRFVAAPIETVFFTIASPNGDRNQHPDIFAWIENWGWLQAHSTLSGAPTEYDTRYDARVWTRTK